MLKYYLTLMTIGATGIGIASQILPHIAQPVEADLTSLGVTGVLFLTLGLVGIVVFNSIVGIRADMIMYARTVNRVRGYFVQKDAKLKTFLVLPCHDKKPGFREPVLNYFFSEVILVGFLNSLLLTLAISLLIDVKAVEVLLTRPTWEMLSAFSLSVVSLTAVHAAYYFLSSRMREHRYETEHGYLNADFTAVSR
jgi:hypothetical protein